MKGESNREDYESWRVKAAFYHRGIILLLKLRDTIHRVDEVTLCKGVRFLNYLLRNS